MAEKKDVWDKLRIGSTVIGAVLIPVVVGLVGLEVNTAVKERDVQARMVELAVGILREEPVEEDKPLRQWAIEVINAHSGVELGEAATSLLERRLPTPGQIYGGTYRRITEANVTYSLIEGALERRFTQEERRQLYRLAKNGDMSFEEFKKELGARFTEDELRAMEPLMDDLWRDFTF